MGHLALQCKDQAELMLLASLRHKTASGTARSNRGVGLPSCSAPRFIIPQNCLWDVEERNVGGINNSVPRDLIKQKVNKGLGIPECCAPPFLPVQGAVLYHNKVETRSAGQFQLFMASISFRGSLVP